MNFLRRSRSIIFGLLSLSLVLLSSPSGANSNGPNFGLPTGVAASNGRLWIANFKGGVTEVSASSGVVIRKIPNRGNLIDPVAIVAQGAFVWVASYAMSSVTEINANSGAVLRVATQGISGPTALAISGNRLWVDNYGNNSLTELNLATGSPIMELHSASYGFNQSLNIAVGGGKVWVANDNGNSVTEIQASSGRLVELLNSSSDRLAEPYSLAFANGYLFVTNSVPASISVINTASDSLVRQIAIPPSTSNNANIPMAIIVDRGKVWVANGFGNSVIAFNESDGSVAFNFEQSFDEARSIAASNGFIWVASYANSTLTQFNETNGLEEQVVK